MTIPQVSVPQPFTVIDQEDPQTYHQIAEFFDQILAQLQLTPGQAAAFSQRNVRSLGLANEFHLQNRMDFVSDNRLYELVVNDMLVATVYQRRTALNYTEFTFASYLHPNTIDRISQWLSRLLQPPPD